MDGRLSGSPQGQRKVRERYMKGQSALVASDREVPMCAVAATCDFTKTPAARSCSRTASVPIGPISAGRGRRTRTHSGQRRRVSHHGRAFPQLRGSFGRQSVNTVKPSAQPTLVRTQHLPPPAKTAPGLRKRGPGPFSSCHVVCQGVSLRVDAARWLRTYSGRARVPPGRSVRTVGFPRTATDGGSGGGFGLDVRCGVERASPVCPPAVPPGSWARAAGEGGCADERAGGPGERDGGRAGGASPARPRVRRLCARPWAPVRR
jgi:hypothetical protein